ncbi:hypothetical protein BN3661_02208 [Eubacteriaceae bacterium CHKCI005]|nr:hypothetical protein BN3661_02208 [Eubacteriaceae bacterium CHKCI005]
MWTNSLLIAVLGVGLLVVLAIVLAMGIEIIRQIVLDKQDKPMQRSVDELTKRRSNNDTTRVG